MCHHFEPAEEWEAALEAEEESESPETESDERERVTEPEVPTADD